MVLQRAKDALRRCDLCGHKCGANRLKGKKGLCGCGENPVVYTCGPHLGEEPPLSGRFGSGTIFFSQCNLNCVYCQNYKFSRNIKGNQVSGEMLADIMLELQGKKCHNVNFVTPTPHVPVLIEAVMLASKRGFNLPVVYNTSGYDSPEAIKLLEGVVDIYLPDMRYSSDKMAAKYSGAPDYVGNNRVIVKEMFKQVGGLVLNSEGIAEKGLMIRLLILPDDISGTEKTLDFISKNLGKNVYLSVMSQYYPAYKALKYKSLSKKISREHYDRIIGKMKTLELDNGWIQPFEGEFDSAYHGENF